MDVQRFFNQTVHIKVIDKQSRWLDMSILDQKAKQPLPRLRSHTFICSPQCRR